MVPFYVQGDSKVLDRVVYNLIELGSLILQPGLILLNHPVYVLTLWAERRNVHNAFVFPVQTSPQK
jgi:hypothetical protein